MGSSSRLIKSIFVNYLVSLIISVSILLLFLEDVPTFCIGAENTDISFKNIETNTLTLLGWFTSSIIAILILSACRRFQIPKRKALIIAAVLLLGLYYLTFSYFEIRNDVTDRYDDKLWVVGDSLIVDKKTSDSLLIYFQKESFLELYGGKCTEIWGRKSIRSNEILITRYFITICVLFGFLLGTLEYSFTSQ